MIFWYNVKRKDGPEAKSVAGERSDKDTVRKEEDVVSKKGPRAFKTFNWTEKALRTKIARNPNGSDSSPPPFLFYFLPSELFPKKKEEISRNATRYNELPDSEFWRRHEFRKAIANLGDCGARILHISRKYPRVTSHIPSIYIILYLLYVFSGNFWKGYQNILKNFIISSGG